MAYADGGHSEHASSKRAGYLTFNLSATVGGAVDYLIHPRFLIRAQPFYQRSLTSIVADDDAKEYLYAFGLSVGAHYRFK